MPSHFYGLPRPKGFTIAEVEHALMLANKDAMVQLLTFFEAEGKPKRSSNINLELLQVLISQNGLEHDSEDLFEAEGQAGPLLRLPVAPRNTLEEQARMRYDYYRFTPYGRDILEYYHLQLVSAQEQATEVIGEDKGVRVTKAQLLNVFDPKATTEETFTGGPEKLLSEAYAAAAADGYAQLLRQHQQRLQSTWGNSSDGFLTRIEPSGYQLAGLYDKRLDIFFRLGAVAGQKARGEHIQVRGCLYLLISQQTHRLYLKASVSKVDQQGKPHPNQHLEVTRTLAEGELPGDVFGELVDSIRRIK